MDGLDLSLPSQKRPGYPSAMMLFHKYQGILLSCIGAANMVRNYSVCNMLFFLPI